MAPKYKNIEVSITIPIGESDLTRYVFDGSSLAQEHKWFASENEDEWSYAYGYITRDYLRNLSGVRQRESADGQNFVDRHLFEDSGSISARTDRASTTSIARTMRLLSGERLPDAVLSSGVTAENWSNLSHLASADSMVESFGGGTIDETKGFDGLQQVGDRHYLSGVGRFISPKGNNPWIILPLVMLFLIFLKGDQPLQKSEKEAVKDDETDAEFPTIKASDPSEAFQFDTYRGDL